MRRTTVCFAICGVTKGTQRDGCSRNWLRVWSLRSSYVHCRGAMRIKVGGAGVERIAAVVAMEIRMVGLH